jgi:hypothetical protein
MGLCNSKITPNVDIEINIIDASNENIENIDEIVYENNNENKFDDQLLETYIYEIKNMNILTDENLMEIQTMSNEYKQQIIVTYNSILKYISNNL